jgi:putative nucleotidyltransferase with HDIG domain
MLKKISVDHLTLGMHLHAFCGAWIDHPFWRTKFVLKDPKDLELILNSIITEVWIDASKGLDVQVGQATEESEEADISRDGEHVDAGKPALPPERVSMEQEVQRAAKICAKAKGAVLSMFQEARMGKAVDAEQAQVLVEEISNSVLRNPGALISIARLKNADEYTYMHSVAVCALMIALARQLGLDDRQTKEAGMAGLLHDLGKALIPSEILNKPGKLTDDEFAVIKTHPEEGFKLLLEGANVSDVTKDVCLHHHEKVDGSGYPKRLKDADISLYAKMGAVCDVYDAITSNRPYKAGWDPAESLRKMAEWAKGHFDEKVFQAFVKSLGIYPIGSFVRLDSGRMGVVLEQNDKSLLKPRVKVFFSAKSQAYIKPEILDLGKVPDKIAAREDPAKWGIKNYDMYWAGDAHPAS